MAGSHESASPPAVHLSTVLGLGIVDLRDDRVGRVRDLVAHLRGDEYPRVSGFLASIGGRDVFLPIEQASLGTEDVRLKQEKVDLRRFERRSGEVLLRADVLGHRLIDVRTARFVRAYDVDLVQAESGDWTVTGLDTHTRRWPIRLFQRTSAERPAADWKAFEPLIGYVPHTRGLGRLRRLRRLRPAQLADLLEESSKEEGEDILEEVHRDPELEADVFEELETDHQVRLLESREDGDVAAILARMAPDDAADLVVELDQDRRTHVLDLLPDPMRRKVRRLLGYNPTSAGGMMSPDLVAVAKSISVQDALERVRVATDLPPEELSVIYVVGGDGTLVATVTLSNLVQAEPSAPVESVAERDPVCVSATADTVEVSLLMTDYDLIALPVVDDHGRLLGQISVDDVLEAIVPEDWRRREQGIPAGAQLDESG